MKYRRAEREGSVPSRPPFFFSRRRPGKRRTEARVAGTSLGRDMAAGYAATGKVYTMNCSFVVERISRRRTWVGLAGLLAVVGWAGAAGAVDLRIATFNCSLSPDQAEGPNSLVSRLSTGDDEQARLVAEIVQRVNPDILLLNEFNWDPAGKALDLFKEKYLDKGHDACGTGTPSEPIKFAYHYLPTGDGSPFNTGIPSGRDLDKDGRTDGPADAWGFGNFPGQYGMVVLSKYPIDAANVRTFQRLRWRDMPGNLIPTPYYSPADVETLRLSSKSHWDVPIRVDGQTLHVLASHPTPPAFDGPEDRNGRRNHDEIRFWLDYITPGQGDYIYDDDQFAESGEHAPASPSGGLAAGARFVIMGDQNADPVDGQTFPEAIRGLLTSPLVNDSFTPSSPAGPEAARLQAEYNRMQKGDPAYDTSAFGEHGNLRVDYAMPSANVTICGGGVYWLPTDSPLFKLVTDGQFPSDHRLVYVDVSLPAAAGPDGGSNGSTGGAPAEPGRRSVAPARP